MSRSDGLTTEAQTSPLAELKREAFEAMSEEEQAFLSGLAKDLIKQLEDTEALMAFNLKAQMLDMEEELALWGLLPSKVRTAIKRGRGEAGQ